MKRGKADYVPVAELGIHPTIKEKLLGRSVQTLKDDVGFWHQAGYDYIKLQPAADFNPDKLFLQDNENTTLNDDGSVSLNWTTEGKGIISSFDDFEKYRFPEKSDFDYSRFEEIRQYLPEGMGVIGQHGDIFIMVWELMGFEEFSFALYDNPKLIEALFDKIGNLVLSMFEYFAESDNVDVLCDDIAEVKQRYGDRLSLIGHVDVDLLSRGTPEQIRDQVRKNIAEAAYNGGYCVGSGNSIPEYVKFENYLEMLAAAKEFGR